MEKVIKWFSQNHVAANFLMLLVLLAGFATWFQLRKEIFPETSFDAVVVSVPYPNATPDEVTNGVIIPMEEAIADIEGIKRVTSNASRNVGAMTIEVETGYETRNVMDDVKTQIDAIDNFAENAERPVLEELIINRQILSLAISADTDEASLREYAETVRDGLLNYEAGEPKGVSQKLSRFLKGDPEIKKVELASVRDYEISIEVSEDRLRQYGLTIQQVAASVGKASLDLPSGSVKTASGEIVVRGIGKRYRGADFFGIVVKANPDGSVVKLEEVAEIIDGFEDSELSSTFNGNSGWCFTSLAWGSRIR